MDRLLPQAQAEGQHASAVLAALAPYRAAIGQDDGARVVEAAHAAEHAVGMVEAAVLLHQDHDMLGVPEGGAWSRLNGGRPLNGCKQESR